MHATVQLSEALTRQLEKLAADEGTSLDSLVRLLLSEHRKHGPISPGHQRRKICFPLIQKEETGIILPVTGTDLDNIFALDDIAS